MDMISEIRKNGRENLETRIEERRKLCIDAEEKLHKIEKLKNNIPSDISDLIKKLGTYDRNEKPLLNSKHLNVIKKTEIPEKTEKLKIEELKVEELKVEEKSDRPIYHIYGPITININ